MPTKLPPRRSYKPPTPRSAPAKCIHMWLRRLAGGHIRASRSLRATLAAPTAAATDRYFGRTNRTVKVVAFSVKVCDGPQPQCTRRVTGEFNNDNMLERVITWVPDPVLGDKMVEYRWSDYRDVGNGVKYPFRLHAHMGDHPLIPGGHNYLDLRTQDVKINAADAAQAVPDAVRNAPVPTQTNVV